MKIIQCNSPDGNLKKGASYVVEREDRWYYYITVEGARDAGWSKTRFTVISDDGAEMSDEAIFRQILKKSDLGSDSISVDHLKRIDNHFLEELNRLGVVRTDHSPSHWSVSAPGVAPFRITNPSLTSLSKGNLFAKVELNREIKKYLGLITLDSKNEEQVMAMTDRKKIAMEAVRLLPNANSYAFGGFVRDHLANEEFNDLDLYLYGGYAKVDYIKNLKSQGFQIAHLRKGGGYMTEKMEHNVYSVSKDGITFNIDLVEDPDGYGGTPVKDNVWDADVNQLYMRKDGSVSTGFGCRSNLEVIKQKIKNKEYTPLPGLTTARREKLAAKGYYQTGAKRPEAKTEGSTNMDTKATAPIAATKASFMDKLKVNAEDAAYRVAATQMTTGTKAAILAIMEKQGQGSERIAAIAEMLDTEVGSALVAGLLGLGLAYAPMVSEDPRAQRLADEFQVSGMATVGNAVVGIAMEHFVPVVMGALSTLPQPTVKQMRVATREEEKKIAAPAIELEDNSATPQPAAKSANAAR
jgi:hypothetical protein